MKPISNPNIIYAFVLIFIPAQFLFSFLLFSSNQPKMDSLAPFSPPLSVFKTYVSSQTITLVLKEKVLSLSGEDYSVRKTNGDEVIRCQGRTLSFLLHRQDFRDTET